MIEKTSGDWLTVTDRVAAQPLSVYDMVVTPLVTPVTTPPETVASVVEELQVPPGVVLDSVIVCPVHTVLLAPVRAAGAGFTVMVMRVELAVVEVTHPVGVITTLTVLPSARVLVV